jgi:ATP-binding cassette, subfamily B, bacterial
VVDRDLRRAISLIAPYWRRLALVMVLSLVSTAVSLYLPLLSRDVFDGALLGHDAGRLVRIVGLFALISLGSFALNVISGLRYTRVSADILFDMRLVMYRHLHRLSPRFYARTRLGDIMSRINNDIGEIQRIAAETALAWFGNVLFLVGTVGMLLWLDWRLFLISAATAPFGIWALARFRGRLEEHVTVLRQRSADIGSFLIETIQGVRLVVTANAQEREVQRFRDKNRAFVKALMSMQLLTYLSGGLPGLIMTAGTGAVFLYGGLQVIHGTLTLGTFVAYMTCQMRFLPPMQALMGLYANLATARVSLRRVSEILDVPADVEAPAAPVRLPSVGGEISFEDVSLSFDRGMPVLEQLSFAVRAGEVLAIVGPSGSGKSTIADLLLRLVDPDRGVVRLDGHDLRSVDLTDLRRHVALVDQQPVILHASVAENIRYARPEASDRDVEMAAREAALDGFIDGLPQKFDTIVGERGAALSVGERQRLAMARAFLADPAVLVLDEPSAALDPQSERRIVEGYGNVMRGRTIIVITHRLDLARKADRIVVLDGARIVEHGQAGQLQARNGRFAELFAVEQVTAPNLD